MTLTNRWPQVGDDAIDYRAASRSWDTDSIGTPTRIKTVTATLVITTDGAKYNRAGLYPINEGPQSARRLVPTHFAPVLCTQGRAKLRELARQVQNLADLHRTDPAEIVGVFAQIITATAAARNEFIGLTTQASRAEQESDR